jgi:hypothetical protein
MRIGESIKTYEGFLAFAANKLASQGKAGPAALDMANLSSTAVGLIDAQIGAVETVTAGYER